MDLIESIIRALEANGVTERWWFFEPYVEITWFAEEDVTRCVEDILSESDIGEYKFSTPKDGQFADWYGLSPEEREFGARRYARIAEVTRLFEEQKGVIEDGLGQERHFMRSCHVMANQLAMNYQEEGIALLKRGIIALLFWNLGHEKAVEVYEKMFNEKYM
jgi:hypothetical protein